jgi:hypothetical protein
MTRIRTIVSVVFVLLLGSLIVVAEYPRFKRIEKRGPSPEGVTATLPGNMDMAVAAVGATFNDWADFIAPNRTNPYQNKFPNGSKWSHLFLFRKSDSQHPLFPPDEEILLDREMDDFADRYMRIPAELRMRDLYLYEPTGDYFWESEYFYQGRPAKFRCSFFIHLQAANDSATRVEIFEHQPTIWVGEYLGMSAHAVLPTMLQDIRPAQSTTAERKEVLQMIEEAATRRPVTPPQRAQRARVLGIPARN